MGKIHLSAVAMSITVAAAGLRPGHVNTPSLMTEPEGLVGPVLTENCIRLLDNL